MKLHLLAVGLVVSFGMYACEEEGEQAAEETAMADKPVEAAPAPAPAPAPEPAKPAMPSVAEVCGKMIDAAKAKDEGAFTSNTLNMPADMDPAAKEALVAAWAGASCGDAKEEGEKGNAMVTMDKQQRDVPYVKAADGWKMDAAAYLSKYPMKKSKLKAKAKKAKTKKAK